MEQANSEKALLLILHGSPRPAANKPALDIADTFRKSKQFQLVIVAYLECNEPTIPEAIEQCARQGISEIIAVPYFLHTGRHQVIDVPRHLIQGEIDHPGLTIKMTDPVGTSPLVAEALARRADDA